MRRDQLREFGLGVRLGIACLLLVILGGVAASVAHLQFHHQNRDEQPGLSMRDIRGAYHGVRAPAPILTALERGHPEELPEPDRRVLLDWLGGNRISEDYDNLDLGDAAPAEIIARECLSCHARNATEGEGIGQQWPLEYWDDVRAAAFSTEINPTSIEILTASTHAHALSLAPLTIVLILLLLGTRWSRWLVGVAAILLGAGLLCDMGSWWLARHEVAFVWGIVVAGGVYNGLMVVGCAAVLMDLLLPGKRRKAG